MISGCKKQRNCFGIQNYQSQISLFNVVIVLMHILLISLRHRKVSHRQHIGSSKRKMTVRNSLTKRQSYGIMGVTEGSVELMKAIPIGVENFKKLIDKDYYFADKTLLIKDLLDAQADVSLFTRPRRFGKTVYRNVEKHRNPHFSSYC